MGNQFRRWKTLNSNCEEEKGKSSLYQGRGNAQFTDKREAVENYDRPSPGKDIKIFIQFHKKISDNTKSYAIQMLFRQWSGRPGFNPRLRHTKDFKIGTWYLFA